MIRTSFFSALICVLLSTTACDCGGGGSGGTGDVGVNGNTNGDVGVNGNTNGDGGANGNTNGDGGTNGNTNGSVDGGDGGNGNTNGSPDAGDLGVTCTGLPASVVCPGKCGFVSDGCIGVIDCSATGNGGVTCAAGTEQCINSTCTPIVIDSGMPCVPTTNCQTANNTCGQMVDDCGIVLDCSVGNTPCTQNQACVPDPGDGHLSCVGGTQSCAGALCNSLPTCSASSPTRLTGTVVTPGTDFDGDGTFINRIPVPNAVVYIPADPGTPLPDIYEGVDAANPLSCGRCADEVFVAAGQSVLAAGITDYKGEFTLTGRIPVNVPFNLVVKVGKWRRVIQVPANVSSSCNTVALGTQYTRLAANTSDGLAGTHLPKIAITTGDVDAIECVLRGAGISESEFTLPTGNGRIHMYHANGTSFAGSCSGTTTWNFTNHNCSDSRTRTIDHDNNNNTADVSVNVENYGCWNGNTGCSWTNDVSTTLLASQANMNAYDVLVMDCEGNEHNYSATQEANMLTYVDDGGRFFASHFAYTWIEANGTLDQSAEWGITGAQNSDTAYISMPSGTTLRPQANPVKSLQFRDWLDYLGALQGTVYGLPLETPTTPQFTVLNPRDRAGTFSGPSTDEWVYINNNGVKIQQLSFNTPYGSAEANACGRVAYSGFHVANAPRTDYMQFPRECSNAALNAQESILLYMLFDLNACVSAGDPVTPPSCTADTVQTVCPQPNDACGFVSDGCSGVLDCGGCATGYYCDVNACKPIPVCQPQTCGSLGYNCGQFPDGCGGIADNASGNDTGCGVCQPGMACGPNGQCITGGCTPDLNACANQNLQCGTASNGCGGTVTCPGCFPTDVCISGICYPSL